MSIVRDMRRRWESGAMANRQRWFRLLPLCRLLAAMGKPTYNNQRLIKQVGVYGPDLWHDMLPLLPFRDWFHLYGSPRVDTLYTASVCLL